MRRTLVRFAACLFVLVLLPRPAAAQAPAAPPFSRPTLSASVRAQASPETQAIVQVVETFLRSEDFHDRAALDSVLHPDARGWADPNGEAEHEPWSRYLAWLRSDQKKPAPRDHSSDVREITDLVRRGSLAHAVLKVEVSRPAGPPLTTFWGLQFMKSAGRWIVVSLAAWTDRYEGQTDDRTLAAMGVEPGMAVGEVGAGEGRFTVALARGVGARGKVYANDIDAGALAALEARCRRLGLGNVEPVLGRVEAAGLPRQALDLVIMVSVFHHLDQPVALLRDIAASLKPGGTVVILDPAYDRTRETDSARPSTPASVAREAAEAGYELVRVEAFLPSDNIYILRPRPGGEE